MKVIQIILLLLISSVSVASDKGEYMLSEKELAVLKVGKSVAEELAKKLQNSGDPKKIEALDLMNQMALIKQFLVSRTMTVPVAHCMSVEGGENLKKLYDQWIDTAKDDIRNGYEIIKDGFQGMSYEEMDKGTIAKIEELESKYSSYSEDELKSECVKNKKSISVFLAGYENT
ncbi:hypothetical protein ACG1BZ_21345 [Microbulbifer sp. CNSA002]|uniref:hypothetical protein n=1 Tax=Microbulbifer sp. CNSA002 TaxID=3373604 RepID=UPI0039B49308